MSCRVIQILSLHSPLCNNWNIDDLLRWRCRCGSSPPTEGSLTSLSTYPQTLSKPPPFSKPVMPSLRMRLFMALMGQCKTGKAQRKEMASEVKTGLTTCIWSYSAMFFACLFQVRIKKGWSIKLKTRQTPSAANRMLQKQTTQAVSSGIHSLEYFSIKLPNELLSKQLLSVSWNGVKKSCQNSQEKHRKPWEKIWQNKGKVQQKYVV